MKNDRAIIRKYLSYFSVALFIFCLLLYILDLALGNGDGLISRFRFSPLVVLLFGQLILLSSFLVASEKIRLANSGLVILSVIIILILIETAFHFLAPYGGGHRIENLGNRPIFSRQDEVYFKNYQPNSRFITHVEGSDGKFAVLNEINSDGIRGPEISIKKEDEVRILLLGDSYIQADEIEYDKTIGQVLETLLPDTFRVIQHGSPSWSPLLELNWLLRKGLKLKPDFVILFLVYNDFYRGNQGSDVGYKQYCIFDSIGYPKGFHFDDRRIIKPWFHIKQGLGNLKLVTLVRTKLSTEFAKKFSLSDYRQLLTMPAPEYEMADDHYGFMATLRDTSIWDGDTRDRIEISMHYLELMKNILDQHNIRFGIALVPHVLQFDDENAQFRKYMGFDDFVLPESGLQQRLRKFCHTQDISFIPLLEVFKEYKSKSKTEKLYFSSDGHFNQTGHQVTAENIYSSLFLY